MPKLRVGSGLAKVSVPVLVNGALDTKTNPKLVQAGALLELENMYQLKTGELRLRNGFAAFGKTTVDGFTLAGMRAIWPGLAGEVMSLADTTLGAAATSPSLLVRTGTPAVIPGTAANWTETTTGKLVYRWQSAKAAALKARVGEQAPYPTAVPPPGTSISALADLTLPDESQGGGVVSTVWRANSNSATGLWYHALVDQSTGTIVAGPFQLPVGSQNWKAVYSQGFHCLIGIVPGGVDLLIRKVSPGGATADATIAAGAIAVAQPWFDVMVDSVSGNIVIAYRATAGGVSVRTYNPATNATVLGPVNTAGADASMTLGWLNNAGATGSFLLGTAGSASGVVVRVMSQGALAVTATNTIDAAATTNVRNITGYVRTGVADFVALWDVTAASTFNTVVRRGDWTGAATLQSLFQSHGLVSRAFKMTDGLWYVLCSYDTTVNTAYQLFMVSHPIASLTISDVGRSPMLSALDRRAGGPVSTGGLASVRTLPTGEYGIPVAVTASKSQRVIAELQINNAARTVRPRELGRTLFIPGGMLTQHDGAAVSWATFPLVPEPPTLVSSATGSMTPSGSYDYYVVYRRTDATGRVTRSATSVAASITLGAGDARVTITYKVPRLFPSYQAWIAVEFYRRGPTASGAQAINLVGSVITNPTDTSDTATYIDTISDATAAANELLYTTGGILDNFNPPSHQILEVNASRVWLVNAEDPTELWPSKEYKAGLGIGFNPLLAFKVTGDGAGAITALASMDGRLIVFKSTAIWVITGDGPNDAGQGSFNPPANVSRNVGTVLPGSVVLTPDGVMFQAANGIYLLGRGLGLEYIGAAVEQYTLAESVVDASPVTGQTQVRFVMPSGRCLVWDYHHKRWYTFKLRTDSSGVASTVVACADIPSGWCYALADGSVFQETPGVYSDVNGTTTAIVPRLGFPHLDLNGLNGYQRVYAVQILGDVTGACTLAIDAEYDYSGAVTGTPKTIALTTGTGSFQVEYNPPEGKNKCSSIRPVLTTSVQAAGSGGFTITALSILVGAKKGSAVPYGKRLT
jgi:hypothetical protein